MYTIRRNGVSRGEQRAGVAFAAPWLVGFAVLVAGPFVASLLLSFCRWDMIRPPAWVGWENYLRLIAELRSNTGFATALQNTAYYSLLSVPLSIAFGIGLAVIAHWPIRGQAFFRTAFFLPAMIPVLAVCVLWMWLLDPRAGWVNGALGWLGIAPQNWLQQARSAASWETWELARNGVGDTRGLRSIFGAKDALVLISLWTVGNFMVIYLAALGDIPRSLYEAAEMEGAGRWHRFWHITIPQLSPVIFFNLVVGLIRSVQTFASIYVLSEGTALQSNRCCSFRCIYF